MVLDWFGVVWEWFGVVLEWFGVVWEWFGMVLEWFGMVLEWFGVVLEWFGVVLQSHIHTIKIEDKHDLFHKTYIHKQQKQSITKNKHPHRVRWFVLHFE